MIWGFLFLQSSFPKGFCVLGYFVCLFSISVSGSCCCPAVADFACPNALLGSAFAKQLFCKRSLLLTFPVCCSVSSSQCGMKFVVLSIPGTSRQQPCEVNKDVLKTVLYKWRNGGKRLICLRPGPDWQLELGLKAFLLPTFLFKHNVLENLQDEFQKVTTFWF